MTVAGVAVVGERFRVQGFTLAGAVVHAADDAATVRSVWASLGDDVAVVVLTPRAAAALEAELAEGSPTPLTVVMPS
ncbi:MAG TPA: V-type ATP synthase subunit F [Actinomycetota bacterium]|nr:V-type ATP synthase subunit F [Actinomycetota bacterium]